VKELAEKMTVDYVECLRTLNVTSIDHMPRATEQHRRNENDDSEAH